MKKLNIVFFLIFLFFHISCQFITDNKTEENTQPVERYNRKTWKHWIDSDNDCINTRSEILQKRSLIPVKFSRKGCTVVSGLWNDYYFPEKHYLATDVDIDHLVPLKNAHDSGGAHWTVDQKRIFANDEENLVITYKKYNREKGSQGIDTWLPKDKSYACQYVQDWVKIKKKYELTLSARERESFELLMKNCR